MSKLIIDNHVIKQDIKSIIHELKKYSSPGKLKSAKYEKDNVTITCPVHKDGQENTPSCNIFVGESEDIIWGTVHCFACGFKGQLYDFIAECCDKTQSWGKSWLKDNFTDLVLDDAIIEIDDPIILNKKKINKEVIDESILEKYQNWHPYMQERKLTKEVCQKFEIKYDTKSQCIVFPVRDLSGNLKFLTRRSINSTNNFRIIFRYKYRVIFKCKTNLILIDHFIIYKGHSRSSSINHNFLKLHFLIITVFNIENLKVCKFSIKINIHN